MTAGAGGAYGANNRRRWHLLWRYLDGGIIGIISVPLSRRRNGTSHRRNGGMWTAGDHCVSAATAAAALVIWKGVTYHLSELKTGSMGA